MVVGQVSWSFGSAEDVGMVRTVLRVVGVCVGVYALVNVFFASMFRMDTAGELPWVLRMDMVVGAATALATLLCRIPAPGQGTARWHAWTAITAALLWAAVSGGLMWIHYEQYRIRSSD
jgi:hypothetical protein